jgi:hypothetical protein
MIFFLKKLKNIFSSYFMETLEDKIQPKFSQNSAFKFYCKFCDYGTSKKCNFDTHNLSNRHYKTTASYDERQNSAKIQPQITSNFNCECGKQYLCRQSLWKHKKTCSFNGVEQAKLPSEQNNHPVEKLDEPSDKQLIMLLIKENSELRKEQSDIKELILEIVKNGTHNTTNTTHTNSHNKAFNLNFFLNETCKNAMNITDFVDSIKLQLSDLMEVGELGYVEGISKIIVKNLNNLDESVRPVHCTDKKRETMYVKDQGEWEKEDEKKSKIIKAVKKVADKNIRLLPAFREKYPEYKNSSSKTSDKYDKMVLEVMTCDDDKNEKIIKNISRVTQIKNKS